MRDNKIKPTTTYYVCPFDGTYSGEMQYLGKVNIDHLTFDEIDALKGEPIICERVQCPKCQRVFGWHQLKKVEEEEEIILIRMK